MNTPTFSFSCSASPKQSFDVAVVGGGIAGVAAAVAAARQGMKTCLIEKQIGLGGLATLGIVTIYLPLCDGRGHQVIGGIGEELLRLSVRDLKVENKEAKFRGIPSCWEKEGDPEERKKIRFDTVFNPALYTLTLESWLLEAGVTLFYDTRLIEVQKKSSRLSHLIVNNKSGTFAIATQTVVDASGDADVCALAGEETECSNANVAAGWFYYLQNGIAHLSMSTHPYRGDLDASKLTCAGYDGTIGQDVTAQVIESHALIRREVQRLQSQNPGTTIEPFTIPSIPCFRATRRLVGAESMTEAQMHQWLPGTVALTGDWRRNGPVFAITLDMLRGVANENLITAGRCFSMDKTIWDCGRVIPTCAVTGEAAGIAAALAVRHCHGSIRALDAQRLQNTLRETGNLLDASLVRE